MQALGCTNNAKTANNTVSETTSQTIESGLRLGTCDWHPGTLIDVVPNAVWHLNCTPETAKSLPPCPNSISPVCKKQVPNQCKKYTLCIVFYIVKQVFHTCRSRAGISLQLTNTCQLVLLEVPMRWCGMFHLRVVERVYQCLALLHTAAAI